MVEPWVPETSSLVGRDHLEAGLSGIVHGGGALWT